MSAGFRVSTTPHFERELKKLCRAHSELSGYFSRALKMLEADPYSQKGGYPIRKLVGVSPGDGQYRLRLGRFRLRYDIETETVYLKSVALRSETTYR